MWLEDSLWGTAALNELGEVDKDQTKQDLWSCWFCLNQATRTDWKASSLFGSKQRGSRKVRQEGKAGQGSFVSSLQLWATGAPSHGGPLPECTEHTSEVYHPKPRELGHLFTNTCPSLVETCSWGINSQGLPGEPSDQELQVTAVESCPRTQVQ